MDKGGDYLGLNNKINSDCNHHRQIQSSDGIIHFTDIEKYNPCFGQIK